MSGDTSDHGGEVESEQIVLPLNNRVKEKTVFSLVNIVSCILLVLNFRGFIKIEAKSILPKKPFSEGAEVMRKNVRIARRQNKKIKVENLPWPGLTRS